DRPEFPWLFTPLPPGGPDNGRLAPWIALIVIESRLASFRPPSGPMMPQSVFVPKGQLQPLDDSWAFAHAQILGTTADATSISDRLSTEHAPANLSRLLCPKRLKPNT